MGSEQNDGTSYQPSEPRPCANNCGFWGRSDTMNMCSKCYRDYQIKEQQAAMAKAAMEKSLNPKSVAVGGSEMVVAPSAERSTGSSSSLSLEIAAAAAVNANEPAGGKAANRCKCCNRKVGLTGFHCRCGLTFCGSHRYPESHHCTFDFRTTGRDAIAKANPVVKADKVERF